MSRLVDSIVSMPIAYTGSLSTIPLLLLTLRNFLLHSKCVTPAPRMSFKGVPSSILQRNKISCSQLIPAFINLLLRPHVALLAAGGL